MGTEKPTRITTLAELSRLVTSKRSVVVPTRIWAAKPIPAAVVINMTGTIIMGMFKAGMYLYEPKRKGAKHDPK
ncbi:MAG: hypothetical protein QM570_01950 [Planctomycetota bacterium]|nr:hypothetical protein [Planctomycetota bacterium]